jgi:hypothetical protein
MDIGTPDTEREVVVIPLEEPLPLAITIEAPIEEPVRE